MLSACTTFQLSNQLTTCHETWHGHYPVGAHANAIIFISLQSAVTTSRLENEALSSTPVKPKQPPLPNSWITSIASSYPARWKPHLHCSTVAGIQEGGKRPNTDFSCTALLGVRKITSTYALAFSVQINYRLTWTLFNRTINFWNYF